MGEKVAVDGMGSYESKLRIVRGGQGDQSNWTSRPVQASTVYSVEACRQIKQACFNSIVFMRLHTLVLRAALLNGSFVTYRKGMFIK
jgi:hypothetical protein